MSTLYLYEVLVAQRDLKRGLVLALSEAEAAQELLARFKPAMVLSLRLLPGWLSAVLKQSPLVDSTLSEKDLAPVLRQLALLLKAGVPVDECMANLVSDAVEAKNARAGHVLRRMTADLQGGLQISAAMAKQPDSFPEMVRCLAVVGDQTGLIDESLMEAADHLEKSLKLKSNFKQALIYPIFTFGAMFGAAAFWIIYVVPNMASLFKQMNVKLPPLTVATMAASEWIAQYYPLVFGITGALLVLHVMTWRSKPGYRLGWLKAMARVPIVKDLLLMSTLSVIFQNLKVLYGRGIDLVTALNITQESISNEWHLSRFKLVTSQVTQGFTLSDAFRACRLFPNVAVTIVSAGERSGTLDNQFAYLANHYVEKLDALTSRLSEIIKPLIVVVAGGFFIFMIVALLLPVYDLVKQTMATMR